MYIMYADESGDTGLPASGSPTRYFCLSGVVVHELRWKEVLGRLTQFRRWLRHKYSIHLEDELHHAEMVGKTKKLSQTISRLPKHQRLGVIRHHVDEIARIHDLRVINIVIDKINPKISSSDDVFRSSWYRLFQRFENTIQRRNFPGPSNSAECGMVFPDRTDGNRLRRYLNQMRFRNPLRIPGQIAGSFTYSDKPIQTIIEDPIVRDSHHSYFVQVADLCAFLLKRYIEPSGFMKKHGANVYFRRFEPILCRVASLTDPLGIVRL
jgi:hypothetical protein